MSLGKRKCAAMYGIQSHNTHWQVIIKRNGVQWNKTFPFSTHGGPDAALLHAQTWRDEIVRTLPPITRRQKAETLLRTNTSGVAGVTCNKAPDGTPRLWTAKTELPDSVLRKSFSVSRYGEQAKQLAIAERQKQLLHLIGRTSPHPAEVTLRTASKKVVSLEPPAPTVRATVVKRNNTSGVAGVYYRKGSDGRSGYWAAATSPAGASAVTKCFSVKLYGEDQAKELAIAEREKQLKELTDYFYRHAGNRSSRHVHGARGSD